MRKKKVRMRLIRTLFLDGRMRPAGDVVLIEPHAAGDHMLSGKAELLDVVIDLQAVIDARRGIDHEHQT
jgi:hypothetical protein